MQKKIQFELELFCKQKKVNTQILLLPNLGLQTIAWGEATTNVFKTKHNLISS